MNTRTDIQKLRCSLIDFAVKLQLHTGRGHHNQSQLARGLLIRIASGGSRVYIDVFAADFHTVFHIAQMVKVWCKLERFNWSGSAYWSLINT
jgi:hypothetical protein